MNAALGFSVRNSIWMKTAPSFSFFHFTLFHLEGSRHKCCQFKFLRLIMIFNLVRYEPCQYDSLLHWSQWVNMSGAVMYLSSPCYFAAFLVITKSVWSWDQRWIKPTQSLAHLENFISAIIRSCEICYLNTKRLVLEMYKLLTISLQNRMLTTYLIFVRYTYILTTITSESSRGKLIEQSYVKLIFNLIVIFID